MRKVAIIISSLGPGGAERQAIELVSQLASAEIPVLLFVLENHIGVSMDGKLANNIVLNLSNARNGHFGYFLLAKKIRKSIIEYQVSHVFAFGVNVASLTKLSSVFLNIDVCASERTIPWRHKDKLSKKIMRALFYPHMSRLICQSNLVANWFAKKFPKVPTAVIPNFSVNVELRERVVFPYTHTFVCVARMRAEKGHTRLLDAFANISDEIPDWGLVLVGGGALLTQTKEYAAELGISERVLFYGDVNNPLDYVQAGSVFVLPSYYEGYPNALCEALALGKVCVAFKSAVGHVDLIQHDQTGLLCSDEPHDLASTLLRLAKDSELRKRLEHNVRCNPPKITNKEIVEKWLSIIN